MLRLTSGLIRPVFIIFFTEFVVNLMKLFKIDFMCFPVVRIS